MELGCARIPHIWNYLIELSWNCVKVENLRHWNIAGLQDLVLIQMLVNNLFSMVYFEYLFTIPVKASEVVFLIYVLSYIVLHDFAILRQGLCPELQFLSFALIELLEPHVLRGIILVICIFIFSSIII